MAAAVTNLFPGTQCGIGPATEEGFFYDFVVERPFVPEDLDAIEKKMKELASQDLPYERQMVPRDEARRFFAARHEPLKVQLIEEKTEGQSEVSCYTIKDRETFVDFCVGPHVPSTGRLKAFKLLSTSNAYWKGDAQQPADAADLRDGVLPKGVERAPDANRRSEKARSPQARKRARALQVPSVGAGRDRSGCRRARRSCICSRNYMREVLFPAGYVEVRAPLVFNKALWETSGTLAALSSEHVPAAGGGRAEVGLKPMNCPGHMLLFGSEVRSYRDLPLRIHEQTACTAMEASGVLSGLTRVRQFIRTTRTSSCVRTRLAKKSSGCCGWFGASTTTSG